MAQYKLLTGPFAGEVVEEGQILPNRFSDLDDDMKIRVRQFGEDKYFPNGNDNESDFPVSLDQLLEEYENSWDSEEI